MISGGKAQKAAARKARLSAALRENLKRRKAQARGRAENRVADDNLPEQAQIEPSAPDFRRNRGRD
jgi:hypothetical protein